MSQIPSTSSLTESPGALRRWVAIQRNPHSGVKARRRELLDLIARLRELGFRPRLFSRRERLARWMNDSVRRSSLVCLVAAGGDGTVCDLMTRYPGVPLAIFPLGTENLLAKSLKITRSGRRLAEIIAGGKTVRRDVMQLGQRRGNLMISVGIDAAIVRAVHAERRGHISRWSYAWHIFWMLLGYRFHDFEVLLDDDPRIHLAQHLLIVNDPSYALGLRIVGMANPADGMLDLRVFRRAGFWSMLWRFLRAATGGLDRHAGSVVLQGRRVTVRASTEVAVQMDGDPAGTVPFTVEIIPQALEVFVP